MDAKATSAMHVIKKEDKYSILREFIAQDLDTRRKAPAKDCDTTYCVIARSPESPVARAVAKHADEARALGISIFVVFAFNGPGVKAPACRKNNDGDTAPARLIQDCRLLDAHEALLLGADAAWVGDCMRRDPAHCDAYERFSTNCTFTAASVRSAFDQLWHGARSFPSSWLTQARSQAPADLSEAELIASSAWSAEVESNLRTPSTRH